MIDITHKSNTLRTAVAEAIVEVSKAETIKCLLDKKVPKGDVLEAARVAGLFGVKKTAELIPDCHPLPIEYTNVSFQIEGLQIRITMSVKTIYKTGVEVEAMHGASVVALTIYDMLKPIDKGIAIKEIKLKEKRGGKSEYLDKKLEVITAAILVCSDTVSAGTKQDKAGKVISAKLMEAGVSVKEYCVVPDEIQEIQEKVRSWAEAGLQLILTTGGTGLSIRDSTPEAIQPLLDREIPGIAETMRSYGQNRMPYAMLSRSIAGTIKNSLIITLPGSLKGAEESMDALFPHVIHVFNIFKGARHN